MDYQERQQNFIITWMYETNCHISGRVNIKWQSESGRFIVAYHHSHAEYVNRMTGNKTCKTFFCLYDLKRVEGDKSIPKEYIKKWECRWNKDRKKEVEEVVQKTIEKDAWNLYCEETKNDMDVKDFWEELDEETKKKYLMRAMT